MVERVVVDGLALGDALVGGVVVDGVVVGRSCGGGRTMIVMCGVLVTVDVGGARRHAVGGT